MVGSSGQPIHSPQGLPSWSIMLLAHPAIVPGASWQAANKGRSASTWRLRSCQRDRAGVLSGSLIAELSANAGGLGEEAAKAHVPAPAAAANHLENCLRVVGVLIAWDSPHARGLGPIAGASIVPIGPLPLWTTGTSCANHGT
jgi:hypothetical protein